jgi:DNA-binding response OmpR family regulator
MIDFSKVSAKEAVKTIEYAQYIEYTAPHILIVDDEELICKELVQYLRWRGHRANYQSDPAESVAIIEREKPRAILVDINMQGLNGTRLVEIVQNLGYDGAVLLMSADPHAVFRANTEKANVLCVLEKPISMAALEKYVRAVLI